MPVKTILPVVCVVCCALAAQAEIQERPVAYTHDGVALEGVLMYDDALEGRRPGVLVVHEWWGLNDYARDRARKLAELGYVAFALDMYGKGRTTTDPRQASAWAEPFHGEDTALVQGRARAGLDQLLASEFVDPERLAAIGYCFGGAVVQHLAYSGAPLDAIVSFHGSAVIPPPDSRIHASVLFCHGGADPMVPFDSLQRLGDALTAAGADWQIVVYGNALHSFTNPAADTVGIDGVGYDHLADQRSWDAMQRLFAEKLGRPESD